MEHLIQNIKDFIGSDNSSIHALFIVLTFLFTFFKRIRQILMLPWEGLKWLRNWYIEFRLRQKEKCVREILKRGKDGLVPIIANEVEMQLDQFKKELDSIKYRQSALMSETRYLKNMEREDVDCLKSQIQNLDDKITIILKLIDKEK